MKIGKSTKTVRSLVMKKIWFKLDGLIQKEIKNYSVYSYLHISINRQVFMRIPNPFLGQTDNTIYKYGNR